MRRNIAMIIGFISNQVNTNGEFSYKEEILHLIIQTTEKLLQNPQMIAYSMQVDRASGSIIKIISSTVKQNTSKSMSTEEIKGKYAQILKVLKTRSCDEPKTVSADLTNAFEKNLLVKKEFKNKVLHEEQKKFEMWEEKSQWEKEETKRVLEIAGLKEKELLSKVKLAANGSTPLGPSLKLSHIFNENASGPVIENLKKLYEAKQGENNLQREYLLGRLKESKVLGQCQAETIQSFGDYVDSKTLLPLLKVNFSRIEDSDPNIAQLYVKEQTGCQENVVVDGVSLEGQEVEKQSSFIQANEEKEEEDEEAPFKYLMNVAVTNEKNFKFRVNKALQQCRRLKEMICLEQTLKGSGERNEEIIKDFTAKMTEFDRNVVYTSLGKKFEAGLSEEFQKIIEGARKELLAIKEDFSEYEEAKNQIPKAVAAAEEDNQGEDEEYGNFDYDFRFLAEEEKQENDEEEGYEDEEQEKDENGVSAEKNEKIERLLNSFEVDDNFIMSVIELFFCYFNPSSKNEELMEEFLRDSISLNPANELKIIDTMITVLYTPEFFEHHFKKQGYNYEEAVEKILNYLAKYYEKTTRTYIFFVPKVYLEDFGNKILQDMKEATNFAQKVSDCHTVLDIILNLIETTGFSGKDQWIVKVVEGFSTLISKEKDVKLQENASQTDSYKRVISCKRVLSLLHLIEKPEMTSSLLKVQELYLSFNSTPGLFMSLEDSLSNHFYQTIAKMNLVIAEKILILKKKQHQEKDLMKADIQEILAYLNAGEFNLVLTILLSFASVFYANLGKKSKTSKKLEAILRKVTGQLFNEEEVKAFFVNIYELAELLNKIQPQNDFKALLNLIIMICIGHYSIIIMETSLEEKKPELRKQTGGSSLSDIEQMPSLARLVSHEGPESHEMTAPLQRSYSHYRRELDVDFGAIFANFSLKHSAQVSNIVLQLTATASLLNNLITIIIPKFPWIIDFKSKMSLFKRRFEEHLKQNNVDKDNQREIEVDRKNLVFSTMKVFKDCSKEDLIRYNEIVFLNEEGVDGGGLIREFYETISKQLFDPCLGLFKLAENQISIQPNPESGIIPYDSTLMQFAGILVAKAISEQKQMNVNFTKPFLKHILGKTITIGDMEEVDADLGKNLRWILENNIEDLYLTYTHEIEVLGERRMIELQKGGSEIFVDEENKKEYVKQICEYRMTKQIKKQLQDFLKGFRMVLPKHLTSYFSTSELEILIGGESKIDLEEMKKYAILRQYTTSDQIIKWLWEVLAEFSQDQLAAFYYFISGSTQVPFGGFKAHPIRIEPNSNKDILPIAHTCSIEIELPDYDSKEKLRQKLLIAIFDGAEGFLMR